jgi:deferrochelatase/peroxidase EfeB
VKRRHFLGAALAGSAAVALPSCSDAPASAGESTRYLDFRGPHQSGVAEVGQPSGLMAAFTVVAEHREDVRQLFATLTTESERLMTGIPYEEKGPEFPPAYTGAVGNPIPPANLSVLASVGASLFDGRYGLAGRIPTELTKMPFLANDRLDPDRSHGDLLLSIASAHTDFDIFALRQLMRATRGGLVLKWMVDGYNRGTSEKPGQAAHVRNLMGFKDGTVNIDATDEQLLDRHVWVGPNDGEPPWAVGGSYHVVRVIRMFVEFWDRTRLVEQERLIGRKKDSGDLLGRRPPIDSHIRLANPQSPDTAQQVILRKGLNYSRGFDGSGQLDQGLAFVSFQRSMSRQFLPIAERLKGEGLEEYLRPEGGGFYYLLPGPRKGSYLGEGLLA